MNLHIHGYCRKRIRLDFGTEQRGSLADCTARQHGPDPGPTGPVREGHDEGQDHLRSAILRNGLQQGPLQQR